MKISTSLMGAVVLAAASLASSAVYAADISTAPEALTLLDGAADFGDSFAKNNGGNTFADHFTFALTTQSSLDAIVSSIARTATVGLAVTSLDLYGAGGLIKHGTQADTGTIDIWTLSADNLLAGNYYLQVSGKLVSATSGSYGASMLAQPVPEPETYAMMLGGLGLLGLIGRRRKPQAGQA